MVNSICEDASQPTVGDILVVDDTPVNLQVLFNMLVEQRYKVRVAPTGELALMNAEAAPPDLILLDIMMPDLSGYEVCKRLKANPHLRNIPIIFISALDQLEDIIQAFKMGGVDFVTKPFQSEEVLARISAHLTIHRLQRQLAIANQELQNANCQLTQEIERRKLIEDKLARLAKTDQLTNALNRHALFETGAQEVARAHRYQHPLTVLMLDIDRFKLINDQLGHAVGDLAIQQAVKTLRQNLRRIDHIGRYGGDEFVIILPETDWREAQQTAERLRLAVDNRNILHHPSLNVSISIGVAGIWRRQPDDFMAFEALLLLADQGLYHAKAAGRNCIKAAPGSAAEMLND